MSLEDEQSELVAEMKTKALELEVTLRETELKVEVLKRDKSLLLEEVEKSKQRDKTINQLWEGNLNDLEISR
jgi:hypothetical protein